MVAIGHHGEDGKRSAATLAAQLLAPVVWLGPLSLPLAGELGLAGLVVNASGAGLSFDGHQPHAALAIATTLGSSLVRSAPRSIT